MKISGRRVIRQKKVQARTGYGRTMVYLKSRDPHDPFPAAIQLGPGAIGFFEDEIDEWLENRPRVKCHDGSVKAGLREANGDTGQAAA